MRSQSVVWKEFLNLLIEQQQVGADLAHKRLLLDSWSAGMERSKHDRDEHRRYWDAGYAVKCLAKYEAEAHETQEKFDTNQKKLCDLADELVAILKANEPAGGLIKS